MKIAIDFDDVIVDTMREFEWMYNSGEYPTPGLCVYEKMDKWGLARKLGCSDEMIMDIFNDIDYDDVDEVPGAKDAILRLDTEHVITVLTANKRPTAVRRKLNSMGLRMIPMVQTGNKAGWVRERHYDALIDDKPSTLKGAVTVGLHFVIAFDRPWNQESIPGLYARVNSWDDITNLLLESSPAANPVDEEIIVEPNGGMQSKIAGRFDLLPPLAIKEIAKVYDEGARKYADNNWKKLDIDSILNHAILHLFDYMQDSNTTDLSHAACRLTMALQLHLEREAALKEAANAVVTAHRLSKLKSVVEGLPKGRLG